MNHFGSVVTAYIIIWVLLMSYQFSISRRLTGVRRDVERLKDTLNSNSRS